MLKKKEFRQLSLILCNVAAMLQSIKLSCLNSCSLHCQGQHHYRRQTCKDYNYLFLGLHKKFTLIREISGSHVLPTNATYQDQHVCSNRVQALLPCMYAPIGFKHCCHACTLHLEYLSTKSMQSFERYGLRNHKSVHYDVNILM